MGRNLHAFLRDIRFEHRESRTVMAKKLGLSLSELLAIEKLRKPIPEGFMDNIRRLYLSSN